MRSLCLGLCGLTSVTGMQGSPHALEAGGAEWPGFWPSQGWLVHFWGLSVFFLPKTFPFPRQSNLLFAASTVPQQGELQWELPGPIAGPPWGGSPTACPVAISLKRRGGLGMGNMEKTQNFHLTPYAISLPARSRLSESSAPRKTQRGTSITHLTQMSAPLQRPSLSSSAFPILTLSI